MAGQLAAHGADLPVVPPAVSTRRTLLVKLEAVSGSASRYQAADAHHKNDSDPATHSPEPGKTIGHRGSSLVSSGQLRRRISPYYGNFLQADLLRDPLHVIGVYRPRGVQCPANEMELLDLSLSTIPYIDGNLAP